MNQKTIAIIFFSLFACVASAMECDMKLIGQFDNAGLLYPDSPDHYAKNPQQVPIIEHNWAALETYNRLNSERKVAILNLNSSTFYSTSSDLLKESGQTKFFFFETTDSKPAIGLRNPQIENGYELFLLNMNTGKFLKKKIDFTGLDKELTDSYKVKVFPLAKKGDDVVVQWEGQRFSEPYNSRMSHLILDLNGKATKRVDVNVPHSFMPPESCLSKHTWGREYYFQGVVNEEDAIFFHYASTCTLAKSFALLLKKKALIDAPNNSLIDLPLKRVEVDHYLPLTGPVVEYRKYISRDVEPDPIKGNRYASIKNGSSQDVLMYPNLLMDILDKDFVSLWWIKSTNSKTMHAVTVTGRYEVQSSVLSCKSIAP